VETRATDSGGFRVTAVIPFTREDEVED